MAARVASPSPHKSTPETLSIDLDRLLARLEKQLLSPTADTSSLAQSAYQRSRVGANVEYARTLVLRLDHASASIRTGTAKASAQSDLATKRDLIKRLNQRLLELNQLDDTSASSDSDSDSDSDVQGEDGAASKGGKTGPGAPREFEPAQKASAGLDYDPLIVAGIKGLPTASEDIAASQSLRSRGPAAKATATATANPTSTDNRSQAEKATTTALFGDRNAANPSSSSSSKQHPTTTTQVLESSEQEQNLLTSSLVTLAQSLKSSSLSFQQSLAAEKEVLLRAESGLEKNEMGMEKAGRGMGTLRRMTEGQGWWGRMKLYAIIAGLWLACFLLVFLGPKLRF